MRIDLSEQTVWHPVHRGHRGTRREGVAAQNALVEGFTKKYKAHALAWYEQHETKESAMLREKALKAWKREWKLELIEKSNLEWRDPYPEIAQG